MSLARQLHHSPRCHCNKFHGPNTRLPSLGRSGIPILVDPVRSGGTVIGNSRTLTSGHWPMTSTCCWLDQEDEVRSHVRPGGISPGVTNDHLRLATVPGADADAPLPRARTFQNIGTRRPRTGTAPPFLPVTSTAGPRRSLRFGGASTGPGVCMYARTGGYVAPLPWMSSPSTRICRRTGDRPTITGGLQKSRSGRPSPDGKRPVTTPSRIAQLHSERCRNEPSTIATAIPIRLVRPWPNTSAYR